MPLHITYMADRREDATEWAVVEAESGDIIERDLPSEEAAIKRKDELEAAAELFPAVQSFMIDGRTIEARLIPDTDDDGWDLFEGDEHLNPGAIVWCEGGLGKYGGITEADVRTFLKKNP